MIIADTCLLSVSDTEILLWDWRYPTESTSCGGAKDPSDDYYSVRPIGCTNANCCYQSAAVCDDRKMLAVATSNDQVLLYDVLSHQQVSEFNGHTGYVISSKVAPSYPKVSSKFQVSVGDYHCVYDCRVLIAFALICGRIVTSLDFAPTPAGADMPQWLLSGSLDETVMVIVSSGFLAPFHA